MEMTEVFSAFELGEALSCVPYGCGHINSTFEVVTKDGGHYVLQKINTGVFRDVDALMENIVGVTAFLRDKCLAGGGNPEREVLRVHTTASGRPYFRAADGVCYRVYSFIEHTVSLQVVKHPEELYAAGLAFGNFAAALSAYPAEKLHETIPHFHDTVSRYADFEVAVAKDPLKRAAGVAAEIDFVRARKNETGILLDLMTRGEIPLRVTHNDTKLNNVLLDEETEAPVAVIDLDTVMPGSALYDFGDAIRFGSNPAAEDEQNLNKVYCELPFFEAYTRGYLAACGESLTEKEIELLPFSARLMTYECGIRFLTDYLLGDTYFRIHRPAQNLDRCRTQFRLVADMEKKADTMAKIVAACRK